MKLLGHYGYFGLTGNYESLYRFFRGVRVAWRKWLGRRSDSGCMPWDRMLRLLRHYPLPRPRIARPYSAT